MHKCYHYHTLRLGINEVFKMMSWRQGVGNKKDLVPCFLSPFLNPLSKMSRRPQFISGSKCSHVLHATWSWNYFYSAFFYSVTLCVNNVINNRINVGRYDFYRHPQMVGSCAAQIHSGYQGSREKKKQVAWLACYLFWLNVFGNRKCQRHFKMSISSQFVVHKEDDLRGTLSLFSLLLRSEFFPLNSDFN